MTGKRGVRTHEARRAQRGLSLLASLKTLIPLSPPSSHFMKFKYDLDYILKITKLSKEYILELLKYFDGLPLQAKLEVFYISKIIEEDDEFAFHQHYFDKEKSAEYEFSLFILGTERIYSIEHKDTEGKKLSSYKLNLISKIKELRKQDE